MTVRDCREKKSRIRRGTLAGRRGKGRGNHEVETAVRRYASAAGGKEDEEFVN